MMLSPATSHSIEVTRLLKLLSSSRAKPHAAEKSFQLLAEDLRIGVVAGRESFLKGGGRGHRAAMVADSRTRCNSGACLRPQCASNTFLVLPPNPTQVTFTSLAIPHWRYAGAVRTPQPAALPEAFAPAGPKTSWGVLRNVGFIRAPHLPQWGGHLYLYREHR